MLSLSTAAHVPATVQARFFYGMKKDVITSARQRQDSEHCVWFDTRVVQARVTSDLRFVSSPSLNWLSGGDSPQVYTVVFEASGSPTDTEIRLSYTDLETTYLADAIQIEVRPGSTQLSQPVIQEIRSEQQEAQRKSAEKHQIQLQQPDKSRCWIARVRPPESLAGVPSATLMASMVQGSCPVRSLTPDESPNRPPTVGD
jgi:hypothetical protein